MSDDKEKEQQQEDTHDVIPDIALEGVYHLVPKGAEESKPGEGMPPITDEKK